MRLMLCVLSAIFAGAPGLAQFPPELGDLPEAAFFKALPTRFPAEDIAPLAPFVANDVQVYRDGKLVFRSREAWLNDLRSSGAPKGPDSPAGYTVSRNYIGEASDGGIIVGEFSFPIAPAGRTVIYHPINPRSFATYRFKGEKLVRVVYTMSLPE
jgi:hypothetical protein